LIVLSCVSTGNGLNEVQDMAEDTADARTAILSTRNVAKVREGGLRNVAAAAATAATAATATAGSVW
jgi:hypothetical protein